MKKILLQILSLLWKVVRTYALQWLRRFFGRAAIWGAVAMIGLLVLAAAIVLLFSLL